MEMTIMTRLLVITTVAIVVGLLVYQTDSTKIKDYNQISVEEFDYSRYERIIEMFKGYNRFVEPINNPEDAIEKADYLWRDEYGEIAEKHKPYMAFYNTEQDVWLIKGYTPPNHQKPDGTYVMGGNCYCLIKGNTGKVLAIWIEK